MGFPSLSGYETRRGWMEGDALLIAHLPLSVPNGCRHYTSTYSTTWYDALMLSIVIPTLNEAAQIVAVLHGLRALAPEAEVIVADGGSIDGTPELAASYAQVIGAPRGRARQMNAGAAHARGEVLLFLHADTRLPPGAPATIAAALRDPQVA